MDEDQKKEDQELLKIRVQNFKSIQDLQLKLKNELTILIGNNESGKSNILNAIQQINEAKINSNFKNFYSSSETSSRVSYAFEIEDSLVEKIKKLILSSQASQDCKNLENNYKIFSSSLNKAEKEFFSEKKLNNNCEFWNKEFFSITKVIDSKRNDLFISSTKYFSLWSFFFIFLLARFISIDSSQNKAKYFFLTKDFISHWEKEIMNNEHIDLNLLITFCKKVINGSNVFLQKRSGYFNNESFFIEDKKLIFDFKKEINHPTPGERIEAAQSAAKEAQEYKEHKALLKTEKEKIKNFIEILTRVIDYSNTFLKVFYYKGLPAYHHYKFKEALKNPFFSGFWKSIKQSKKDLNKLISYSKESSSVEFETKKRLLENEINKKIEEYINKSENLWRQNTFEFKLVIKNDSLMIKIADVFNKEERGKELKYGDFQTRGDGMTRFFSLLFFLHGVDFKRNKKFIILLDEPDFGLHPQAVIDLRENLNNFLKRNKNLSIVITTHNPFWINEDNINQITFVDKNFKTKGTIISNRLLSKSQEEDVSTLSLFLYKLGLYPELFHRLSNSIIVFVEGYTDVLLFDGMKYYLYNKNNEEKYKKIFFISRDGANKKSILPNVFFAMQKRLPFFIFDYDQAGFNGIKQILENIDFHKNEKFKKRVFFNNFKEINNFKNNCKKVETQNLFENERINDQKISELEKTSDLFFRLQTYLKKGDIKLSQKTQNNFKKIFDHIIEMENNFEKK